MGKAAKRIQKPRPEIKAGQIVENFSYFQAAASLASDLRRNLWRLKPREIRAVSKSKPSKPRPGTGMVPLDRAKGALGLNGAVHAQQSAVDAVEVGKDLRWKRVGSSFRRMIRFPAALEH